MTAGHEGAEPFPNGTQPSWHQPHAVLWQMQEGVCHRWCRRQNFGLRTVRCRGIGGTELCSGRFPGMPPNKHDGWRCCHWDMRSVSGRMKLPVITDGNCGDAGSLGPLTEQTVSVGHRAGKILADAVCDKKVCWNTYIARHRDGHRHQVLPDEEEHARLPGRDEAVRVRGKEKGVALMLKFSRDGQKVRGLQQALGGGMHILGCQAFVRRYPLFQETGDLCRGDGGQILLLNGYREHPYESQGSR